MTSWVDPCITPSMSNAPKKRLPLDEYKKQQREQQAEMLANAVDALQTSEGWRRYLDTRAKFHKYSFNNLILIAMQRPEATQVAGGKQWVKLGRKVTPEGYEQPIFILAPIMVPRKDADKNPVINPKTGKPEQVVVGYRSVKVYDVSQTEGDSLPEPVKPEPIEGDSHEEYLLRGVAYIESLGASVTGEGVEYAWEQGGKGKRLTAVIPAHQPVNAQVRDMLRAASEIVTNDVAASTEEPLSLLQQEVIVESAAYMAMQTVGLDTTSYTVPYLATIVPGEDDPKAIREAFRNFTGLIDEVAKTVTEGIE